MKQISPNAGIVSAVIASRWCVALLAAITVSPAATVRSQGLPPVITVQPQSQVVRAGSNVTFRVEHTGTPPFDYRWRKNGSTIVPFGVATPILTLTNVSFANAGSYSLLIINEAKPLGVITSGALLSVYGVAPGAATLLSENCAPPNYAVDPGETVTMSLALLNSNGPPTTNLTAILEENAGVLSASGPQSYGVLTAGEAPVSRPFTFTAHGPCGSTNFLTLRLSDGSEDWGRVTFPFRLGLVTNNVASCCLDSGAADLALAIAGPSGPVAVGTNLAYIFTVSNGGPATATEIILTNSLPDGLRFVSAQAAQGSCSNNGGSLLCDVGSLGSNATTTVTLTLHRAKAGSITCTAGVTGQESDYDWSNNTRNVQTVAQPEIRIGDASVSEGNSGTTNAQFAVQLSGPSVQVVTVNYFTVDGSASTYYSFYFEDYFPTSGVAVFLPGTTNLSIPVAVRGDPLNETNETFFVRLANAVNATLADSEGLGTIADDGDIGPTLSVNNVTATEGGYAVFTVTLQPLGNRNVSVDFQTTAGTALANSDYTPVSGTLDFVGSFSESQINQTVVVPVTANAPGEPTESFQLQLSNPVGAILAKATGQATIPGEAGTTGLVLDSYVLTAESFTPGNGAIDPGETVTVGLVLTNAGGPSTSNLVATLLPGFGVTAPSGPQDYGFLASGGPSVARPFTFTADGPCGSIAKLRLQLSAGGANLEVKELSVRLGASSNVRNYSFSNSVPIEIIDEDLAIPYPATIAVSGLTGVVQKMTLTLHGLTHSSPSDLVMTVIDPEGDGGFVRLWDRNGGAFGASELDNVTVTFDDDAAAPLPTSTPITSGSYRACCGSSLSAFDGVDPNGSWELRVQDEEEDEEGWINGGWSLDITTHEINCDAGPSQADLGISGIISLSGNTVGEPFAYYFSVDNTGPATATGVVLTYTGRAGWPSPAGTPSQGSCSNAGTALICDLGTIAPGASVTMVLTEEAPDLTAPPDVRGVASVGGNEPDPDHNNNTAAFTPLVHFPYVYALDSAGLEGDSPAGANAVILSLVLYPAVSRPVSVAFSTETWPGADSSATPGVDYLPTNGVLVFPPEATNATLSIPIIGDSLPEPDEFFAIRLFNPTNVTVSSIPIPCAILDDEPRLSINNTSVMEGNTGATMAIFTVGLSRPNSQPVSVLAYTLNDDALAGTDYAPTDQLLTFPPGATTQVFQVPVLGDFLLEPTERFFAELASPIHASLGPARRGTCTVLENDSSERAITVYSVAETEGYNASFLVYLNFSPPTPVSVNFATHSGTAIAGQDFIATNGTLVIPAFTTSRYLSIPTLRDGISEPTETFSIVLSNPNNAFLTETEAIATLYDSDGPPTIRITDAPPAAEATGDSSQFIVSLSIPSSLNVSVSYTTVDGTATAGTDYAGQDRVLIFPPGVTNQSVAVPILGDLIGELHENFFVTLSNPTNAVIGRGQASGTILSGPQLNLAGDMSVTEGNSGQQDAVFTINLSHPADVPVSVKYETSNLTAVEGIDYVAQAGSVVFPPGEANMEVRVPVMGDSLPESAETFALTICCVTNVNLARASAVGTILNDDTPVLNDDFASRIGLAGEMATASGTNSAATKEPGEPDHGGNPGGRSLWWSWAAPASGKLVVSTSGSSFDTLLGVYVGDSPSSLVLIASNDNDGSNLTSRVSFNAAAGQTYQIAVDGKGGNAGQVHLSITLAAGQFYFSNRPREDFWVPDGPVRSVLETNGIVYLGGEFTAVRPNRGPGIALDLELHEPDPDFPQVVGTVYAAVADGDGGWFIGGDFIAVGNVARTNLAHIRADNTVDPSWIPRVSGTVRSLALMEGTLYVGGAFSNLGGQARAFAGALNSTTGDLLPWNPAPNNEVRGVVAAEGTVYLFGIFTAVDVPGKTRNKLAAVDPVTGQATPWNANFSGIEIRALARSCDTVYVGGHFVGGFIGGVNRRSLAALDAVTGQANLTWNPEASFTNEPVNALVLADNTIYIGGGFVQMGGRIRNGLAAVDVVTGRATAWNPNPKGDIIGNITSLALAGDTIYAAGSFTNIGGRDRRGFAALEVASGQAKSWNVESSGRIQALSVSGDRIYAANGVLSFGAMTRRYLAALDATTGEPVAWDAQMDRNTPFPSDSDTNAYGVFALCAGPETVYASGRFSTSWGQSRNGLVALDEKTGLPKNWSASSVFALAASAVATADNHVYAEGYAYSQGDYRDLLNALDADTGDSTGWALSINSNVLALAASANLVYAGGRFTSISNIQRRYLAAVDRTTGIPTAWNPNANGSVLALGFSGDTVLAGGEFTQIGGQLRSYLAALNPQGQATSWSPLPNQAVRALAVSGDTIYAGGDFTAMGPRLGSLAALDAITGDPANWDPKVSASVRSVAVGRNLYAGGTFLTIDGKYRSYFAVFSPEGAPEVLSQPESQVARVGDTNTLAVQVTGHPGLAYQWQFNGTNLVGATNAELVLSNLQTDQAGRYTVIVTNGLGRVRSREAVVNVIVPLEITSQPQSQVVAPGTTNVTLSVTANGFPAPRYQWRLNGANIRGAVGATLTFTNAQPTNGGRYSVIVANLAGALESAAAELIVQSTPLPFQDDLSDAVAQAGVSGVGSGSNLGATRETGETNHVGKLGGRSVWLKWIAPDSGIATFSTRGSAFDTLLAIYTGTGIADLVPVAADEDRGGYLTSQASFNTVAGTEYLIAVDGFAGASGNIILSWSLDITTSPFPRIITQPLSVAVFTGQTSVFNVVVSSMTPAPVTYQWFRGCRPIPDATNATLTLTDVQRADVGAYRVLVRNASTLVAESIEAFLEIGPQPKIVSQDKVEDLFPELLGSSGFFSPASIPAGFLSVSLGSIDSQLLDNSGATTSSGEPIHCGVLGGSSKWLRLRPLVNATFLVDTVGSSIRTVLAVYRDTNLLHLAAGYVTCDLSSAPDGHSLVRFNAAANTDYLVAVDGINGAQGLISLNWKLGLAPGVLPPANGTPIVRNGESTVLQVTVTNIFGATYQWRWKGQNIFGATNNSFTIPLVSRDTAGQYSIVASNFAGMTTNLFNLLVELPYLRAWPTLMNGNYHLLLPDADAPPFILQTSVDLTNWSALYTIGPSNTVPHLDLPATDSLPRFFRAQPWP